MVRACWIAAFAVACGGGGQVEKTKPDPTVTPTTAASPVTEAFRESRWPVDILLVVEDAWYSNLRDQYPAWASTLAQHVDEHSLSAHIGLITMDPFGDATRGRLQEAAGYRWLNHDTADLEGALADLGQVVTLGTSLQSGRDVVQLALVSDGPSNYNEGFLRDDADLALVFVSNQPDYSESDDFIAWANGLKQAPYEVVASSISSGQHPDYPELADTFGGIAVDSATGDWTDVWDSAVNLDPVHMGNLQLTEPPDPSTLEVWTVAEDGDLFPLTEGIGFEWSDADGMVVIAEDFRPPFPATYRVRYLPVSP